MSEEKSAPEGAPKAGPAAAAKGEPEAAPEASKKPDEIGGPKGPEPTRFGDWERQGRCVDF